MKIVMFKRKHACFSYICYFLTIFRSSGSECKSFEPYPVRKKMKSVNITSFWFYYGNFLFVLWMNIVVYDIIFHWINKSVLQFNSLISEMSEMLQLWKWHIYKKREFSLMKQKYFTTHTSKWQKFLIFFLYADSEIRMSRHPWICKTCSYAKPSLAYMTFIFARNTY